MSVTWIIVFHLFTKFEVRRPSRSEDMAVFKGHGDLDLLPFDHGTGTERQPWQGQPSCQFWVVG